MMLNSWDISTTNGEIVFTTTMVNGEDKYPSFNQNPPSILSGFAFIISDDGILYKLDTTGRYYGISDYQATPIISNSAHKSALTASIILRQEWGK